MIRLVLENSRSEKVTLENELETLSLYAEMEVMRFKNKLQYHLTAAPEIDQLFIEIPPLLLQPFVENAIWHGLMHKEEGGTVRVVRRMIIIQGFTWQTATNCWQVNAQGHSGNSGRAWFSAGTPAIYCQS